MGIAKKINWQNIFIFLFLVAFPFGQIIRLRLPILGISVPLLPIDIIAGCAAIYSLLRNLPRPKILKYLLNFLWIAGFSFLFSVLIFKTPYLVYGLFYLIRLTAYVFFFVYVWNFVKEKEANIILLRNSLLGISVVSAVFGWIQFALIPDIKALFVYGWDMHLFRLVGTFLDPTFLGLIIVFGLVLSIYRFIDTRNKKLLIVIAFLLISLAFTYSRASYLAFFAAALLIGYREKLIKKILLIILGMIVAIFLLPTAKNHSIELFRSFSVLARFDNYKNTLHIFSKSPIFGVGYDNMCIAYQKYIGIQDFSSHACSGSDSSLLFILATTGIVGLMIFLSVVFKISKAVVKSNEGKVFIASLLALFVHSIFSNSIFFPWIMGYMFILLAVSVKE
jgi:O-antigen ligase